VWATNEAGGGGLGRWCTRAEAAMCTCRGSHTHVQAAVLRATVVRVNGGGGMRACVIPPLSVSVRGREI
jgi:hypothetical protein